MNVYSASVVGQTIQSLIADGVRTIVIDMTSVRSIDSSGIGTLVGNAKSIGSVGGSICVVGANEGVKQTLERAYLERYVKIYDDQAEAFRGGEPQPVCETSSKGAI